MSEGCSTNLRKSNTTTKSPQAGKKDTWLGTENSRLRATQPALLSALTQPHPLDLSEFIFISSVPKSVAGRRDGSNRELEKEQRRTGGYGKEGSTEGPSFWMLWARTGRQSAERLGSNSPASSFPSLLYQLLLQPLSISRLRGGEKDDFWPLPPLRLLPIISLCTHLQARPANKRWGNANCSL